MVLDRLAALDPEAKAIASHSPSAALYELAGEEQALQSRRRLHPPRPPRPGAPGKHQVGALAQGAVRDGPGTRCHERWRWIAIAFGGLADTQAAFETRSALARTHAILTAITVVIPSTPCRRGRNLDPRQRRVSRPRARGNASILDLAINRVPADLPVGACVC